MNRIPSFSALRAFEATAKFGSLKEAANKLNITPSAVSHQIRGLEKELHVKLFERSKAGVILTKQGKEYLKSIQSAFEIIEQATYTVRPKKDIDVLKISTLSTFSILWLIPKLKSFHKQHPNIRVDLLEDVNICDFTNTDLDAAIRYDFHGKTKWPGLIATPLIEEYVMPVCTEKFLQQHPDIIDLDNLINSRLLINHRHPDEWNDWLSAIGVSSSIKKLTSQVILDTSNMTLTAAKNNLGVALGRTPFVDKFLNNKELVRITPYVQFRTIRHYLVCTENSNKNRSFCKFRDWLVSITSTLNTEYRQSNTKVFV